MWVAVEEGGLVLVGRGVLVRVDDGRGVLVLVGGMYLVVWVGEAGMK